MSKEYTKRKKINTLFYGGIVIIVILVIGIGMIRLDNYQTETSKTPIASVRIENWNDDVVENVSILNKEIVSGGDKLPEGTELWLRFTNLNESKKYVLINDLGETVSTFLYVFSNQSVQDIPIVIDEMIQSINFCAYEFVANSTSWEIFSYTIYFLIQIQLRWSQN